MGNFQILPAIGEILTAAVVFLIILAYSHFVYSTYLRTKRIEERFEGFLASEYCDCVCDCDVAGDGDLRVEVVRREAERLDGCEQEANQRRKEQTEFLQNIDNSLQELTRIARHNGLTFEVNIKSEH